MSRRTLSMTEVTEILYQWVSGVSQRQIAKRTGASRNTVIKIVKQARQLGLQCEQLDEELLLLVSSQITKNLTGCIGKPAGSAQHLLSLHHDQIKKWLDEPHMTVRQLRRLLLELDKSIKVSETSCHRYIKKHFPKPIKSTVVLHTLPGEQAQVDFGYVGLMFDPATQKHRRTHAFVMTLSYSRLRFVKFVFSQDIASWIDCHIEAFKFFGGVPKTILIDNLKSGVIKPDIYDPIINRSYAECARYYNFVIDPAKVRTPTHKGKVERTIQIIRQQIIAGREYNDVHEANVYALHWCRNIIANEVTRTTGETPKERFERDEKDALIILPEVPYEFATWQEALVGSEQHITFQGSFYSLPAKYIGKRLLFKATARMIYIYENGKQVKAHVRLARKGQWSTDDSDFPANAKKYLDRTPDVCLSQARAIGPGIYSILSKLLTRASTSRLRKAQGILRLAEYHSNDRLEEACLYALQFGDTTVDALKKIIAHDLDRLSDASESTMSAKELGIGAFLRNPSEFLTH